MEQKLKELSEKNLEANNLIAHYIAEIDDLEFELGQSNRVIKEQQAEIERLTEDQSFDAMLLYSSGLACEQVKAENDELQKQVNELKVKNEHLESENNRLIDEVSKLLDEGWDIMDKEAEICHNRGYVQGVEETAKEILQELYDQIDENTPKWVGVQIKIIAKRKGVEVE